MIPGFSNRETILVGVHRQYTGTAGKVTNCQVGVSLEIATASQHAPIDFELYLPEKWTEDAERRAKARIPDEVVFKTKIELALGMIERAARAEIPGEIVLADSAYGSSAAFRQGIVSLGFDYAVGIGNQTKVRRVGSNERLGTAMTVADLAKTIPHRRRRQLRWKEGTKSTLSGRFSFCRVKTLHEDGVPIAEREPTWLVIEWRSDEDQGAKFYLTTLPRRMSHKELVRIIKERWRTERMYEDLKGELGLDHFEGRSFRGWHHHVSVVICCGEGGTRAPARRGVRWTCTGTARAWARAIRSRIGSRGGRWGRRPRGFLHSGGRRRCGRWRRGRSRGRSRG